MSQSQRQQPDTGNTICLDLSSSSVIMLLLAIAVGIFAASVLDSASRVISWIIACAIAAALLELVVDALSAFVPKALAIILTLVVTATAAGLLTFGTLRNVDSEIKRFQLVAPQAAYDIASGSRFRNVTDSLQIEQRVNDLVEAMRAPTSGFAGKAASSAGTYFFCAILTVLFLSWGPKVASGLVKQLPAERRNRISQIGLDGFLRSRRYIFAMTLAAISSGLIVFLFSYLANLPAAPALGLMTAAMAFIPTLGIALGSLPAILLAIASLEGLSGLLFTLLIVFLQIAFNRYVYSKIVKFSHVYVGAAITTISLLIGFQLYGFGGAVYCCAIAIFAVSMLEARNNLVTRSSTLEITNSSK